MVQIEVCWRSRHRAYRPKTEPRQSTASTLLQRHRQTKPITGDLDNPTVRPRCAESTVRTA